jgi:toluene monooxygenase system protein D
MKNPVGPVLRMGDEVEQIIAAIEDDNPGTDIEVIDRGAYVRVQGEDQITVTQETLRQYLGADYEIRSPSPGRAWPGTRPRRRRR